MKRNLKWFLYGMLYTTICNAISWQMCKKMGLIQVETDPEVIMSKTMGYYTDVFDKMADCKLGRKIRNHYDRQEAREDAALKLMHQQDRERMAQREARLAEKFNTM